MLDDRKDGDRLTAMAREHATKLSEAVGATLGAEHQSAVEALVNALADRVATMSEAMVAADVALTVELADDAPPRNQRDLQDKLTREAIVDVRERVTGMYGAGILSTLLLASSAPKDPKQLVTFALRAADVIEPMKLGDFPESKIEGGKPSPKKWAGILRKPADALAHIDDGLACELVLKVALVARREHRSGGAPSTRAGRGMGEGRPPKGCNRGDEGVVREFHGRATLRPAPPVSRCPCARERPWGSLRYTVKSSISRFASASRPSWRA